MTPTTDDRPFFFQFEKGIPTDLRRLLWIMIAVLVGGVLLLLWGQRGPNAGSRYVFAVYFAMLGAAFMLTEITIIQQTRLFLGHPVYAITVVLATLLIGGGIGSGLVGWRLSMSDSYSLPLWPLAGVLAVLLAWLALWPLLSNRMYSLQLPWRIATVLLAVLPLASFLGMPFPVGLRSAGRIGSNQVALAWSINAVLSVAGSVAAITLAISFGYSRVLLVAWALYLVALAAAALLNRATWPTIFNS